MKHWIAAVVALAGVYALTPVAQAGSAGSGAPTQLQAEEEGRKAKKKLSDAQVRQILIDESIAAYSGNCPCPYSTMRNGRSCGRRSAYSREGGEAPLCYAKDVSAEMVQAYRESRAQEST